MSWKSVDVYVRGSMNVYKQLLLTSKPIFKIGEKAAFFLFDKTLARLSFL